jgi:hypothetical protein
VWKTRIILSNYFPFPTTTRLWRWWFILIIRLTSLIISVGSTTLLSEKVQLFFWFF